MKRRSAPTLKRFGPMIGTIRWTLERGRPCKPEQTSEDEKNADDDDGHALLLLEPALFVTLGLLDVMQVRKEDGEWR